MGLALGFSANLLNEMGSSRAAISTRQVVGASSLLPIDPGKISLPEDIARVYLASFLAIPGLSR
jgi:hypothetical protein